MTFCVIVLIFLFFAVRIDGNFLDYEQETSGKNDKKLNIVLFFATYDPNCSELNENDLKSLNFLQLKQVARVKVNET